MAFLVTPILHHFMPTICTSIFFVFPFYILFCTFLIFCLLHFPQLIVYDTDTLKVRYFVWDIFELNWNSYRPIFHLFSSFHFYNMTGLESSPPFIYLFFSRCEQCEQWNFWCRLMWTQRRFWSNGALLERPTDPFLPSLHNHRHAPDESHAF